MWLIKLQLRNIALSDNNMQHVDHHQGPLYGPNAMGFALRTFQIVFHHYTYYIFKKQLHCHQTGP